MAGLPANTKDEALEQNLEVFIETCRQLGICAADFQPGAQTGLNQKVQTLVATLKEIDRLKDEYADVQIPIELLDYIDQGKNPQLYTRDCLERTLERNEHIKGKTETLEKFRAMLMVELSKSFPNEIAKYRLIRDDK